jgi:hypothetical protein
MNAYVRNMSGIIKQTKFTRVWQVAGYKSVVYAIHGCSEHGRN